MIRILRKCWNRKVATIIVTIVTSFTIICEISILSIYKRDLNISFETNSERAAWKILRELMVEKIFNAKTLDKSETYKVIMDMFDMEHAYLVLDNDLTLASQTSGNHLNDVVGLVERWDGFISITAFAHSADFDIVVMNLLKLQFCFPKVRNKVFFHLIFPISNGPSEEHFEQLKNLNINCNEPIKKYGGVNYDIKGVAYPNNLARNTALRFCKTQHVFLIDIDLVPNVNLRSDFRKFVATSMYPRDTPTVFIVPAFESISKNCSDIPVDRKDLILKWNQGKIRYFSVDACSFCQTPTDYEKWKLLPEEESLFVAYYPRWKGYWEPFYIAERNFPLFDERFKQYGFNRISQFCEMNMAGYRFGVLNNAFVVHKGFRPRSRILPQQRKENVKNAQLFNLFKKELKVKYANSSRSC